MSELPQLDKLRELIEPEWDAQRHARLERGTRTRVRTSRRRRVGAVAGGAVLVAALVFTIYPSTSEETAPQRSDGANITFADGSQVRPLGPQTRVVVGDVDPTRTEVLLREGGARFEVSSNPQRTFVVRAGSVSVEVVGTEFDVRRDAQNDVSVDVFQGHVRVRAPSGTTDLRAGESEVFSQEIVQREPDELERVRDEPVGMLEVAREDEPPSSSGWRGLAQAGEYEAACVELEAGADVADRVDELMLAADAARLSGRSRMAVGYLTRVVEDHGSDPRSALAAFTLGRIEMAAGSHQAAARWWALARERAGSGSIAEHALAREIEALAAAGNRSLAARRAQEFLRRYPNSDRVESIRQHAQ